MPPFTAQIGGTGIPARITGTAGEAIAQYALVYGDPVTGKLFNAFSSGTSVQANCIAVCSTLGGLVTNGIGVFTVYGLITNTLWGWSPIVDLFVSATPGAIVEVTEESAVYCKPIGWAYSTTQIWFQPQIGWQL